MLPHPQRDIRELGEKVLMLRELVKVMRRDVLHFVRAWGNRHGAASQTVAQTKHPNAQTLQRAPSAAGYMRYSCMLVLVTLQTRSEHKSHTSTSTSLRLSDPPARKMSCIDSFNGICSTPF